MRASPMCLAIIAVSLAACEPLPPTSGSPGPLEIRSQPEGTDAIPFQFGDLVAVTPMAEQSFVHVLWFVQPDKSVVAVRVNVGLGAIGPVLTIPRR